MISYYYYYYSQSKVIFPRSTYRWLCDRRDAEPNLDKDVPDTEFGVEFEDVRILTDFLTPPVSTFTLQSSSLKFSSSSSSSSTSKSW